MKPLNYHVRLDLGGNFYLHFITTPNSYGSADLLSILFDNAPGGGMYTIEASTMDSAQIAAKKFLLQISAIDRRRFSS